MKIEKNTAIKLKSFLGTLNPEKSINENENYWELIGEKGKVVDERENYNGRVLILYRLCIATPVRSCRLGSI